MTLRIAQITDSHVTPAGALWKGRVDGGALLARAVSRLNAIGVDLVVHTGDLTDRGDDASTARAAAILSGLEAPLRVLPGNHDDRAALRHHLPGAVPSSGEFLNWAEDHDGLRVIGLDTLWDGETAGRICPARRDWLAGALSGAPALIFAHHPPCAMGLPFMDGWPLDGSEALAGVLAGRHVLRIACGHVHCAAERHWAGTLVAACPALNVAIPLDADRTAPLGFMLEPPAIRLHDWDDALGLRVQTVPLDPAPGPFFWFDPRED
ncbi:MAG: Icc protein [Paracoccaceae bacterium]|jgi:Icc protein